MYGNDQYLPDPLIADYFGLPEIPPGDIQADPQIPNVQWGDWHIAPTSPCRAAGATGAVVTEWDIDGNPREIDSCADIGAEESGGTNPTVGPPITIYVDTAGCDSSAGTSWSSAVATVQRGVDLAWNAGGGEVWIAGGTYAILWPVELGPFISLYGGFAGNESSLSQRNWQANQTILDGCYLTWPILYAKVGGSVVLDGFTVTDAAGRVQHGFFIHRGYHSKRLDQQQSIQWHCLFLLFPGHHRGQRHCPKQRADGRLGWRHLLLWGPVRHRGDCQYIAQHDQWKLRRRRRAAESIAKA